MDGIKSKSKIWITESLIGLMKEKQYRYITVKEICNRACVDRRTFYRYFNDKEAVLSSCIREFCMEYINELKHTGKLGVYDVAKIYFSLCVKHIDFLKIVKDSDLLFFMLCKFDEYLPDIHKLFRTEKFSERFKNTEDYAIAFHAGGFWNLSVKWLNDGALKTPDDMAIIAVNMLNDLV